MKRIDSFRLCLAKDSYISSNEQDVSFFPFSYFLRTTAEDLEAGLHKKKIQTEPTLPIYLKVM